MGEHPAFPAVVFDFDGVVCDSTDECMVSAWNSWERWHRRPGFRNAVTDFSEDERARFRVVRPRVRGAGEYYVLQRAAAEGHPIDSQSDYDALVRLWKSELEPFKRVFYEMRDRLRKQDLSRWINLHPVYDGVVDIMRQLSAEQRLFVATLKDAESVRLILGSRGLVLPEDRLFDQSMIQSKLQALDQIRERLGCRPADLIFIDDNVTHLTEPSQAEYRVLLAAWGPLLPEYLEIARAQRIDILANDASLRPLLRT